ncbi:MAG TPA: Zn-ribbon domain-containing OB-fold protein [Acidimicrobiales bacterium]
MTDTKGAAPGGAGAESQGANRKGAKDQLVMEDFVSISYREPLTPNLERFADGLLAGKLIGQKCPACGRVYVPGKGYCPLDVVEMGPDDEIEVSDTGTVTGFTIITPIRYYGQKETEPFVHASVLLDGADNALGGQDITGIPHEEIRAGLRVRAVWQPPAERSVEGLSNRGWGGVAGVISSFEPTGEPDADPEQFQEHIF